MFEFSKLRWRIKEPSELERPSGFITEEEASRSLVYKNFKTLITVKKKVTKLKVNERYIPGKTYFVKIKRKSAFDKWKHEHCLKALKLLHSGKEVSSMSLSEKFSLNVYRENNQQLMQENRIYLEYVKKAWEVNKFKTFAINPGTFNYANYCWKENCKRYLNYKNFYEPMRLLNMSYDESEGVVKFECKQNALELGTVARFCQPNLKEKCILKIVTLPNNNMSASVHSRLPVSQDENITKILESHSIDVVISSSSLKQIIDNTDFKMKWIIPVTVKEIKAFDDQKNYVIKKVIFIDKPLPKINPNNLDFKYYTYRQLLKTNFCEYEAFRFPMDDVLVTKNNTQTEEESDPKISISDNNLENETEIQTNISPPPSQTVTTNKKIKKRGSRKIHHNVSYRIWNIKKINHQNELMKNKSKDSEIQLLVRCKLDGCECTEQGLLQPVIINPKIELQLQYGANIPTKRELSREWTSLFFRPFSNLYRARLHGTSAEIVSVEKCTMQKVNTEAFTHYKYKPHLGLGILQKILQELMELETGDYILQHLPKHEAFVALLKASDEKNLLNSYNLHEEYDKCQIDAQITQNWLPIDVNYILPVHENLNQMPAMFEPFERKKRTGKNKKKTKKKSKMME